MTRRTISPMSVLIRASSALSTSTAVPTCISPSSSDFDPLRRFSCQTKVQPHDRLIGNVSVEYALEQFAEGNGPGARVACRWALQHAQGQPVRSILASAALVVALMVVTPALAQTTVEEAREQGKSSAPRSATSDARTVE